MPEDSDKRPYETRVRNEHADEWKPITGPMEWEHSLVAEGVAWKDDRGQHSGVRIRTDDGETFIASTKYVADLRDAV